MENSEDRPSPVVGTPPGGTPAATRTTRHRSQAARGRILIVDDEANARAALSEILHDEGYATE
ncbi:MAG TPA: hypothetical protein VNO21_03535, partial [Polyangiaceae bacterium]|nr:hypothetical protein [Polyangiaceae bacterium]